MRLRIIAFFLCSIVKSFFEPPRFTKFNLHCEVTDSLFFLRKIDVLAFILVCVSKNKNQEISYNYDKTTKTDTETQ